MKNKLTDEKIKQLANILFEDYGISMSLSETEKFGYSLVGYFALLLRLSGKM